MLITVLGNCQADCVTRAIRIATAADPTIEVRYVVAYHDATEADLAALAECDVLVEQLTDNPQRVTAPRDNAAARRIFFPVLEASFLYPFCTKAHPRAGESKRPHIPDGFYEAQMSDSQLIGLMADHPDETPGEIADRYLALDYAELLDLDGLLDLSREKAQRLGARAGLDMWPRIERLFRYQPVYWARLHPAEVLLRPIYRHVLEQLGLGLSDAEIDTAAASGTGLEFGHMPIHPSIARHHGIDWVTPRTRYKFLQEGHFTTHEFASRFAGFEHDGALLESLVVLQSGADSRGAVAQLLRAHDRHPGSGELLMNISSGFCGLGDVPNAFEAAISAVEREPERSEWVRMLCGLSRLLIPKIALHVAAPQPAIEVEAAEAPVAEAPETHLETASNPELLNHDPDEEPPTQVEAAGASVAEPATAHPEAIPDPEPVEPGLDEEPPSHGEAADAPVAERAAAHPEATPDPESVKPGGDEESPIQVEAAAAPGAEPAAAHPEAVPDPKPVIAGAHEAERLVRLGRDAALSLFRSVGAAHVPVSACGPVLEFGCGKGRVLRYWAAFPQVELHGTDSSAEMIAWNAENLPFVRCVANSPEEALSYADEHFGLIYALSVFPCLLPHLQQRLFGEFLRILRPNGLIYFTTAGTDETAVGQGAVPTAEQPSGDRFAAFHSEACVHRDFIEPHGLELVEFLKRGARGNPGQDSWLLRKPLRVAAAGQIAA